MFFDEDLWYTVLTSLGVGIAFGYVAQRGRFCMNSAVRNIILLRDLLIFRIYLLALLTAIAGTQTLLALEVIDIVRVKHFNWLANALGGFIFGMGVVLAGGCDSGSMYRMGEGLLGSWIAVLFFGFSAAVTGMGVLSPVRSYLRSFTIDLDGEALTLVNLTGWSRWSFVALALVFIVLGLLKGARDTHQSGWGWRTTGLLMGGIVTAAWYFSRKADFHYGFTFSGPTADLFAFVTVGVPWYPDWGMLAVVGVPLGSFLGAIAAGEFRLRTPPAHRLVQQAVGGVLMGFGARIAGGCTIGQGITNSATLALGSITTMLFIILGGWAMVYFLFMRE